MKAKKRVVMTPRPPIGSHKRTPTVRRIKSAIVPARPQVRHAPGGMDGSGGNAAVAAGGAGEAGEATGQRGAVDLSVDLGRGLLLPNPVMAASGTFGYGVEHGDAVDVARLGGICTRGTTLRARHGNPPPRVVEVPGGLLNAIGLQNPGIDAVLERYGAAWAAWPVPVVLNVGGESVGEIVELVRRIEGAPGIAAIELNLGCPSNPRGGTLFGLDPDLTASLVGAVRRATDLPILAKLSPGVADPRPVARAAESAGADALTAVNTLTAAAPGRLGVPYGGLSGPALKPIALRVVFEVAQAVDIPVVGVGGVSALDDVLDLLAAGAVAVQVGTACLADPTLPGRLAEELADTCRARGLASYRALVGTALPSRPPPASTRGAEYRP